MAETTLTQPEIATGRLRLRRLRPRDAAVIALYASDARVAHATAAIPHPYPPGGAEAFVERLLSAGADERVWALDTGGDDENGLIGLIRLKLGDAGEVSISYWVAPAFWNAGYASEAVEGIVAYALGNGTTALKAEAFQDDPDSAGVLEHAGFTREGSGEVFSLARGTMVPTFRYLRSLGGGT